MRVRPEQREASVPESARGAAAPAGLDRGSFVARFEGDGQFFDEVAAVFIDDSPRMLGNLVDARNAGDLVALRQAAHALKGAVSNFTDGATREAALETEQLARQGSEAAFAAAGALEPLVHELITALTVATSQHSPGQP
jgi:HPt (histidine-containing phosphotransfer) domain-containing protein